MAEPEDEFIQHAGTVYFPRTTADLTNTRQCPACFAPLNKLVCYVCGLDLNHPAASELATASTDAAALLTRRVSIIGRMRLETTQRTAERKAAAAQPATTTRPVPAAVPWASPAAAGSVPAAATAANAAATSAAPATVAAPPGASAPPPQPVPGQQAPTQPTGPRRSSVQVILLIVGISLLSLAAIFFLVYAFINFGLIWRTVIIAAITIAAFTVASLLKRKNLGATAEGIAVFAVVLVYLDAFALRANDLFGLQSSDTLIYWGIVLLLSSVGFLAWHRLSGLRVASIAAFASLAPGAGVLVAGLGENLDGALRGFLTLAAVSLAGLAHPLAGRKDGFRGIPEKIVLLSIATLATIFAVFVAFTVEPDSDWGASIALLAVGAIAAAHVALFVSRAGAAPRLRIFPAVFAAIAGATAAATVAVAAIHIDNRAFTVIVPVLVAVTVTLALELLVSRQAAGTPLRLPATVAAWSAAGVTGLVLLIPGFIWLSLLVPALSGLSPAWQLAATDLLVEPRDFQFFAVLALAAIAAIAAGFWAASGRLARRRTALTWVVALLLIVAVPLLSVQWAVTAGWLVLGAAGVAALIAFTKRETTVSSLRAAVLATAIVSTALGYLAGWASLDTWIPATLAAIGILVAARWTGKSAHPTPAAVLLGAATVLAFVGAGALAQHIDYTTITDLMFRNNDFSDQIDVARFLGILGAILLALSALPVKALSVMDRRVVFWLSAAVSAGAAASSWYWLAIHEHFDQLLLPEFGTSLVLSTATFGAILLWVVLRANAALRPERIAASIAVGPAVYWIVDSFVRVLGLPQFAESVAPATSALIVAAGALVFTILRPSTTPRWAREIGIGIVAIPAVFQAIVTRGDALWLTLLLTGVTAFFLAIGRDGLFASASMRKHFGWLALALATAGLWVRLGEDNVTDLELYVLPLAGALLLVALLVWRSANRVIDRQPSKAAPFIALGGLLVAILPLSANAITGTDLRAIVLFSVSAALLLLGSLVVGNAGIRPYLDVAALSGAIGVLVTGIGRATELHPNGPGVSDLRFDAWLGAVFLVLFIAAFGQARERADVAARLRLLASQVLGAIALSAVLVLGASALGSGQYGDIRALALVLLFAAVHVIAFVANRAPLTRSIGWLAIAYSVVAMIAGIAFDRLDPLEVGTVPVALALLASGTVHMARTPAARSWPFLGPGVAMLLLPSLLATFFDDKPLWRLVVLGVVSVAVVVIGVVRRLQAPFILGAIVAVIHGIGTFSPQIRALYQAAPWWLWAGIGGVLLILLAARYENRIKNLKDAVLKVSNLR